MSFRDPASGIACLIQFDPGAFVQAQPIETHDAFSQSA
jgi:hypothetical protein